MVFAVETNRQSPFIIPQNFEIKNEEREIGMSKLTLKVLLVVNMISVIVFCWAEAVRGTLPGGYTSRFVRKRDHWRGGIHNLRAF